MRDHPCDKPVPECGIAVMAKASKPGRTKTRLSPPLTGAEAALFNTAFLGDIADNLLDAGTEASIAGYMAFGPPGEKAFFDFLPPQIGLFEAWRPHFGDCLFDTIGALFQRGHRAACVLNADSPTLPPAYLIEAARLLAAPGDRAVLGPSTDGGYYLLGLKHPHARLFADIDWSTDRVARQTLDRAAEIGLEMHLLPIWYDVDDAGALATLCEDVSDGRAFEGSAARPAPARHSRALIERLEREANLAARLDATVHIVGKQIARAAGLDHTARAAGLDHTARAAGLDHTARAAGLDHTARAAGLDHTARAAGLDHTARAAGLVRDQTAR